jgi:hypothetical protein
MLAVTVVAGLALVGVGAGAAFIGSAVASEHIKTGTLTLTISSPDGRSSHDRHTVTWSLSHAGSTILQRHIVTLTNHGTLPLHLTTATFTDPSSGTSLAHDLLANFDGNIGTLAHIEARPYRCVAHCDLRPGQSVCLPLEYTGHVPNNDQGQAVNPTVTINASETSMTHGSGRAGGDGDDDDKTGALPLFTPQH